MYRVSAVTCPGSAPSGLGSAEPGCGDLQCGGLRLSRSSVVRSTNTTPSMQSNDLSTSIFIAVVDARGKESKLRTPPWLYRRPAVWLVHVKSRQSAAIF
jgi:hypothetical protein